MRTLDIEKLTLLKGSHPRPADGDAMPAACVMECVAWAAGEPWTDEPTCACPVLGAFLRNWNDCIQDDAPRTRLLAPMIPRLVGSKSTPAVEERRSYLALDWLIRVHTPAWLDMVPSLQPHAKALREAPEVRDITTAHAVNSLVNAAGDAARAAAWDALKPTVEKLQASALELVERMLAVQP